MTRMCKVIYCSGKERERDLFYTSKAQVWVYSGYFKFDKLFYLQCVYLITYIVFLSIIYQIMYMRFYFSKLYIEIKEKFSKMNTFILSIFTSKHHRLIFYQIYLSYYNVNRITLSQIINLQRPLLLQKFLTPLQVLIIFVVFSTIDITCAFLFVVS